MSVDMDVVGAMAAYAAIAPTTNFIILIISTNYIFVHFLDSKVFNCHEVYYGFRLSYGINCDYFPKQL